MYNKMTDVKESQRRKKRKTYGIMVGIPAKNNISEDNLADARYFNGREVRRSIWRASVAEG